jgi:hypothetical protein
MHPSCECGSAALSRRAEQRVEEEQAQALKQAQQSRQLVFEGLANDRNHLMGVYERVEGKEVSGRGVWQAVGGFHRFLRYSGSKKRWMVSGRKSMEADNGKGSMRVNSTATAPDQITEQWKVSDVIGWHNAPKLRVRVCSSVEKHAAEQRVEQQEEQAMVQAQQSRQLVVEGLVNDRIQSMGAYELMEGKVVNRRAVWQKQGGQWERFLYYSSNNAWVVGKRERMEAGSTTCMMTLATTALTPDQARPSDVWRVGDAAGIRVAAPEVRVQRRI